MKGKVETMTDKRSARIRPMGQGRKKVEKGKALGQKAQLATSASGEGRGKSGRVCLNLGGQGRPEPFSIPEGLLLINHNLNPLRRTEVAFLILTCPISQIPWKF